MSDQQQVIRGINWRELFPFTHLFRTFRISVQLSKIGLALAALILLYCGGLLFDGIWLSRYRALPGEIDVYNTAPSNRAFVEVRQNARKKIAAAYAAQLLELKKIKPGEEMVEVTDLDKAIEAAEAGRYARDLRYWYKTQLAGDLKKLDDKYKEVLKKAEADYQEALKKLGETKHTKEEETRARDKIIAEIDKARADKIRETYNTAGDHMELLTANRGEGLFTAFFHYQTTQLGGISNAVIANNWVGGMGSRPQDPGVIVCLVRYFTVAPAWAIRHHTLYFLLYGTFFLAVWSLFGGAIARIAAVHVADEGRKLSFRQGLEFAIHKFLSFFSAPLIPILIVAAIGLVIAIVCGILMVIPWFGEIVVSLGLILALVGGFVIALIILGAAGGFNLMYPTIAVEGSDSFDAISRSFSYVFARPWRMLFYSLVSVAYGSVCYLFVRVVIWLVLLATHFSVGLFVGRHAGNLENLWDVIWPRPDFSTFTSSMSNTLPLDWAGCTASFFVQVWMYLIVFVLGAFAISFYFCSNTIIYFLLRKDVDATEMDDVFIEETEEDFIDRSTSAEATSVVETAAAPAPAPAPGPGPAPVQTPTAEPAATPPVEASAPAETPAPSAAPASTDTPAPEQTHEQESQPNPPV